MIYRSIAFEKAGIIKKDTPVVIGEDTKGETQMVFKDKAASHNAPLLFADKKNSIDYQTDLLGDYQQKNIKGVVAAVDQLQGFDVSASEIELGAFKCSKKHLLVREVANITRTNPK